MDEALVKAAQRALAMRMAFALFALPGGEPRFIADNGVGEPASGARIELFPWTSSAGQVIAHRWDERTLPLTNPAAEGHCSPLPPSTLKSQYLSDVEELVDRLRVRGGKTVYARVKRFVPVALRTLIGRLFEGRSPHMRALMFTPAAGLWVMSTPETLLRGDSNGRFATMALAGTRPVSRHQEPWDDKNIEEQAIVTRSIAHTLSELGLAYRLEGPSTLVSGTIEHICTRFSGELRGVAPERVAAALSPTPALGGYPRADALADIAALERQSRELYGGYVAFSDGVGGYQAYVTIRCARILEDMSMGVVYGGGGITADSDSESEWLESESKMDSILRIVQ